MTLHNHEAEWQVLSMLAYDNDAMDRVKLATSDFHDSRHSSIFSAISNIIARGGKADIPAIVAKLREARADDIAEDVLKMEPWTAANVEYYAAIVGELSRKRQIVDIMYKVKAGLEEQTSDEILGVIESELTAMSRGRVSAIRRIGEILIPAMRILEERVKNRGTLAGVTSGFTAMDKVTGGFQPQQLIIIGARPSVGKTAMALTMALNAAEKDIDVGFISSEMAGEQITMRALSGIGRVNSIGMMSGYMRDTDFSRILDAGERLREAKVWIDDTPNIAMAALLSSARKMVRLGCRILYMDYLTLIKHGEVRQPRWERTGEISKMLKGLARELNVPIVVLSQVGRQAGDCAPTLADLRQSGEIEEDADVVILLHRPTVDEAGENADQSIHVNVAKNRTGPTDAFYLTFLKEFVRFENQQREGA